MVENLGLIRLYLGKIDGINIFFFPLRHIVSLDRPPKSEELVFRVPDMKRPEPAKEEEGGEAAGQEQAPVTLPA